MKLTDAGEIKNEIEKISNRIDSILKTVKRYYPITEADQETSPAGEAQQDASTCHLKQKPDQEA